MLSEGIFNDALTYYQNSKEREEHIYERKVYVH